MFVGFVTNIRYARVCDVYVYSCHAPPPPFKLGLAARRAALA